METTETIGANMAKAGLKLIRQYLSAKPASKAEIMSKSLGREVRLKVRDNFTPQARPIANPFNGNADRENLFRLAVHQVGHVLSNLIWQGTADGILLAPTTAGGDGRVFGLTATGIDGARNSLAGLAAERLVDGTPLPIESFHGDLAQAKKHLRQAALIEAEIDPKLMSLFQELQAEFSKWVSPITKAATMLVKHRTLNSAELLAILGTAKTVPLAKSIHIHAVGFGSAIAHTDSVTFPRKRLQIRSE